MKTCQEYQHEFDNTNMEERSLEQPSIWTEINFDRSEIIGKFVSTPLFITQNLRTSWTRDSNQKR